jgi:lysophospholipase L1-like esterase
MPAAFAAARDSARVQMALGGQPVGMTSPPGAEVYAALGDSISIDDYAGGPGRGGASLLARNRDDDFPDWSGRDLATVRPELGFRLLAADGATTASVLDAQVPRLESSGAVPRVVTLTVGGNDVLGAYGDTRAALEIVERVRARVGHVLDRLNALCPHRDAIAVGTVYDPSDSTGEAWRVGLPPWPDVVDVLGELNAALRAVASEHGAVVADIHGRFLGHGLEAGDPGREDARPRNRCGTRGSSSPTRGAPTPCAGPSGPPCKNTAGPAAADRGGVWGGRSRCRGCCAGAIEAHGR